MLRLRLLRLFFVALFISVASVNSQTVSWQESPDLATSDLLEKLSTTYDVSAPLNPYYLNGDFNGDCNLDLAVLVRQRGTRKLGIAILRAGSSQIYVLGAGTPFGQGGDDFSWMDTWSIHYKSSNVAQGAGQGPPPTLRGDAIYVAKGGGMSAIIYWTGSGFRWYQQSSIAEWGVGPDGRVYRWNGSSWAEPNPAARLKQVSVSKQGGAVWGLGPDGRIYRWNPKTNSWEEPNPAAHLNQISNLSGVELWGVGANYQIFRTVNAGASWYEPTPSTHLKQVSIGKFDNIWGVTADNHILWFNINTQSWEEPNPNASAYQIDAWTVDGAWAIGDATNFRIFKTYNGLTWYEPNPKAGAHQISGTDDLDAWALGADNRVFQTKNGGLIWSEPNPNAHLMQISIGFE
jgi:photosystem II stability/assembly factor-like uncharacterized protein